MVLVRTSIKTPTRILEKEKEEKKKKKRKKKKEKKKESCTKKE